MWIFTVNGFFTVIQDRKDANFVWLRSRLREDIERNFPGVTAEEHPGADYLFRVKLPREQVAQRLFDLAMENNVTSHFKDVMIRTASKPEFGSRSAMLYGVWNAGAAMQPIPPYSKAPRTKFTGGSGKTWRPGDRSVGAGQGSVFSGYQPQSEGRGLYGGSGSGGFRAADYDWDSNSWGGTSTPDPVLPKAAPKRLSEPELTELVEHGDTDTVLEYLHTVPGDSPAFEIIWSSLSPDEAQRFLDEEEAAQRLREEMFTEVTVTDVQPAPRSRAGNRRQRRKDRKRKNRHNQEQHVHPDPERFFQERRDGLYGKEQQNRQAFIDKQRIEKGTK